MPDRVCGECAEWEARLRMSSLSPWLGYCMPTLRRRKAFVPVVRSESAPAGEQFRERESDAKRN